MRKKYKTISYDRSVTKDYINNQYKGNAETIKNIVDSFNEIFEDDPENMRYSTYAFDDDCYVQISKSPSASWVIPHNTKPYQRIAATNWYNLDYQMPAYFMQYLAFAMKGDLSGFGFWKAEFNKRYIKAKEDIVNYKDMIKSPNYLESYYLITKIIDINCFK